MYIFSHIRSYLHRNVHAYMNVYAHSHGPRLICIYVGMHSSACIHVHVDQMNPEQAAGNVCLVLSEILGSIHGLIASSFQNLLRCGYLSIL